MSSALYRTLSGFQPVQLTISNQTIIFTRALGSTSFLLKAIPLANLDFQRPAVLPLQRLKKKKKSSIGFYFYYNTGKVGKRGVLFPPVSLLSVKGSAGWADSSETRIIFKEGHEKKLGTDEVIRRDWKARGRDRLVPLSDRAQPSPTTQGYRKAGAPPG